MTKDSMNMGPDHGNGQAVEVAREAGNPQAAEAPRPSDAKAVEPDRSRHTPLTSNDVSLDAVTDIAKLGMRSPHWCAGTLIRIAQELHRIRKQAIETSPRLAPLWSGDGPGSMVTRNPAPYAAAPTTPNNQFRTVMIGMQPDETAGDDTEDMANIGRALMERLPKDYHWNDCPTEIVTDLLNQIHDLKQATPDACCQLAEDTKGGEHDLDCSAEEPGGVITERDKLVAAVNRLCPHRGDMPPGMYEEPCPQCLSGDPSRCTDCGVALVPEARHFSGCKSHPGERAVKATELPMCDCDPDFGCKEYDSKIFRCCQQEMEKRAAHLNGDGE